LADDAVQEAWLRLSRVDADSIDNLGGWLTTVVARVCLNVLRSRRTRPEEPLAVHVPDPVVSRGEGADPEREALLADSVGLALLVVLETLTPAERLAFVLHDMFAVPFEEVAEIAGRTPDAVRQLASRARRRVQGAPTVPDGDVGRQREVVDAFFAAARQGDFDALVAVLDPDVVLRSDGGTARPAMTRTLRGAAEVAGGALTYARAALALHPVLVPTR
jgi:RNA polymerase sigma-70 factor (ECF subfamily)